MRKAAVFVCVLASALLIFGLRPTQSGKALEINPERIDGLLAPVEVVEDSDGIPHIFAENDHDAVFMIGYLHARDRLFQMDFFRRTFSGTLAELLGQAALPSDIQLRTLGLRRAAEESLPTYSPLLRSLYESYAAGVNAWVSAPGHALPPEYAALELTSIRPWTPLDTVTVAKGLAFSLSFDDDSGLTAALAAYEAAGDQMGFDGSALFFEDLYRSAPIDSTVSIPDFLPVQPAALAESKTRRYPRVTDTLSPETLEMVRAYHDKLRNTPFLNQLINRNRGTGSNWWVVDGAHSETGNPLLANDPHLGLDTPPIFYEIHVTASNDPISGPMNVNGVSFAGTPLIAQGCNDRICWGSTVNPMDVTDYFEEFLAIDFSTFLPVGTIFDNQREDLVQIPQIYRVNQIGNGETDDLAVADVGITEGGLTLLVPRRNMGPIVSVDTSNLPNLRGLSIQFTGLRATREGEAFYRWTRAGSVEEFKEGLQFFDFGSQNWAYADVDGNIAYFTSAELPLREDLQNMDGVDGMPPFIVRDGTHFFKNEWLPLQGDRRFGQAINFEILPFEEMPQIVNPERGYIANANNDPVGTVQDNDPFNSTRPGGGVYYLSPGYTSLRVGRIARLLEAELADGGKLSVEEMMRIQSNNQLLDAEIFTPFILAAADNADRDGASAALVALAGDPRVAEAVGRLDAWDFSTPTGIQEGYDPGDDPDNLPEPSAEEIANSVAATIYALWRSQAIGNVIDATLERLGLENNRPNSLLAPAALRNLLDNFPQNQGVGASGVDFFVVDGADSREDARDILILQSLQDGLELLASDEFAPAFGNSTDQDDYRWGRLHRIVYDHPLGAVFNIPPAGGFPDLAPDLPGIARAGGYEAVDASAHSVRAASLNAFMFGSGPARRFVGELTPEGPQAFQILPGGQSGVLGHPNQASQLGRWLTNQFHPMRLTRTDVEADAAFRAFFVPENHRLLFPYHQSGPESFTGFAASNLSQALLGLDFSSRDGDGALSSLPTNPRQIDLESAGQTAQLGTDIFEAMAGTAVSGWVALSAPAADPEPLLGPALASFTQFGSFDLEALDGGVAFTQQFKRLIFTRAYEGPEAFRGRPTATFLSIANPNDSPIEVVLEIFEEESGPMALGQVPIQDTTVEIAARGVVFGTLSEIFSEAVTVQNGLIRARVTSGLGAVGNQVIRALDGSTILALNGAVGNGANRAFSAQLASGPNIFTNLKLINIAGRTRNVTLTATDNNGSALASPVELSLASGQSMEADVDQLFDFSANAPAGAEAAVEGSLRVTADGGGVIGDVIFGDPVNLNFAAALPLQTQRFRRAVFSQVANTPDFFTGLALLNDNPAAAEVTIQVFTTDGMLTGQTNFPMQPGTRMTGLLTQFVPQSDGQQQGYIVVMSSQPLVAQQLFGTFRLSLLSAVPPAVVE